MYFGWCTFELIILYIGHRKVSENRDCYKYNDIVIRYTRFIKE